MLDGAGTFWCRCARHSCASVSEEIVFALIERQRERERRTDGHTDGHTDIQTDSVSEEIVFALIIIFNN